MRKSTVIAGRERRPHGTVDRPAAAPAAPATGLAELRAAIDGLPDTDVAVVVDASAVGGPPRCALAGVTWDSESYVLKLVAA